MTDEEYDRCLQKAKESVAFMDSVDGFADRDHKTILFALECGIRRPETNAHFESLVMLHDLIRRGSAHV